MELQSADALILDVLDLGEYDRIITFLTAEQGKKRGVARGARRKHSRFGGHLQPLGKVRLNWLEHEGRELVRISSVESIRAPAALHSDLDGLLLGGYLADHVIQFAQDNEDSHLLFRLLDSTLVALARGVDRRVAARYFEAWVLRLAGVFPSPWQCPECGRDFEPGRVILPAEGDGLVCTECGPPSGALNVASEVIEFLRRIDRESLVKVAASPPSPKALASIEELSKQVRRRFLQQELRSYRVIREAGVEF